MADFVRIFSGDKRL